ncbi:hypothetical protein [Reinekea sp.]|jgi:ssDNA-binding Zn-finger/Zn-ribbon topoisomerase 1|uniref:hypothetical protein n=1 Tax=Reinekea sp. TaxID=1970455 RepID=UPI003989D0D5
MEEKKVQCPACKGRAVVRKNRVGDSFLSCGRCGAWNGRGAAYREWCESLPALAEVKPIAPAVKDEPAVNDESPEKQDDWLDQWGAS